MKLLKILVFYIIRNYLKNVHCIKYSENYSEFLNNTSDQNQIEIDIVEKIILTLKDLNFDLNQIGVITPYKSQETRLAYTLREHDFFNVYTIDKSQGIEK